MKDIEKEVDGITRDRRDLSRLLKDVDGLIRESKNTLINLEAVKARVVATIRRVSNERV